MQKATNHEFKPRAGQAVAEALEQYFGPNCIEGNACEGVEHFALVEKGGPRGLAALCVTVCPSCSEPVRDAYNRQRNEVKAWPGPTGPLAAWSIGQGTSCTMSYWLKLDPDMEPTDSWCHVTQIKSYKGDHNMPIFTWNIKDGHMNACWSPNTDTKLATFGKIPLEAVLGKWVHVEVGGVFDDGAKGRLVVRVKDARCRVLLSSQITGVDTWRGGEFVRFKFGLYRDKRAGLTSTVSFAGFSFAKK